MQWLPRHGQIPLRLKLFLKKHENAHKGIRLRVSVKSCAPEKLQRAQASRCHWDSSFCWKMWKRSQGDTVDVSVKLRSWKIAARAGAQIPLRFKILMKNTKTLTRGYGWPIGEKLRSWKIAARAGAQVLFRFKFMLKNMKTLTRVYAWVCRWKVALLKNCSARRHPDTVDIDCLLKNM